MQKEFCVKDNKIVGLKVERTKADTDFWKKTLLKQTYDGGIAQLARAPALQAGGQRFESVYLHH